MQAGLVEKPGQVIVVVIALVSQIADGLFRLAHGGHRMEHPAILPLPDLPGIRDAVFQKNQLHCIFGQAGMLGHFLVECDLRQLFEPALLIHGQVLGNPHIEGVACLTLDQVGKSSETSRPHS